MLNLFKKNRYHYINTYTYTVSWLKDGEESGVKSHIHYSLYENDRGKRRVDIDCDDILIERKKEATDLYVKIVKPWVLGENLNDLVAKYNRGK